MLLTQENYFSKEADLEYFSVSQYKLFKECPTKAMAIINSEIDATKKEAFLEGQLFEELVAGDAKLFIAQHQDELIAKTGKTAGELKANFKKVLKAAKRFNEQEFFRNIIDKSEKQVILTGNINGVAVKGKLDLLDLKNKLLPDIKCMANFDDSWDKKDKCYKSWYYIYDYVLQLAVYQELVKQNYGIVCDTALLAASKEDNPDVDAPRFDNKLLELELEDFTTNIIYYNDIKKGLIKPPMCGCCDYCKSIKEIKEFREVK